MKSCPQYRQLTPGWLVPVCLLLHDEVPLCFVQPVEDFTVETRHLCVHKTQLYNFEWSLLQWLVCRLNSAQLISYFLYYCSRMIQALLCSATSTTCHPPSPPGWYLCLVALFQGSQVADEAHGEAAPLLSRWILCQAIQQYPRVPSPGQQPQGLHLWEVVRLRREEQEDVQKAF